MLTRLHRLMTTIYSDVAVYMTDRAVKLKAVRRQVNRTLHFQGAQRVVNDVGSSVNNGKYQFLLLLVGMLE